MPHSKFGWSYPPGCSGPPDPPDGPSPLVDSVLELLENASVPTAINDQIVKLIEDWEIAQEQLDEPPIGDEPNFDVPTELPTESDP